MSKKKITLLNYKSIAMDIINDFKNSGKNKIVVINIGTDICIGDCIGPYVGMLIKEQKLKHIKYYGDINNPIHALNIEYILPFLKILHKNDYVIAIDACLSGEVLEKNNVYFRKFPIRPGKGVGKSLGEIGNVSLVGITEIHGKSITFNSTVRLRNVIKLSNIIVHVLKEIDNNIDGGII